MKTPQKTPHTYTDKNETGCCAVPNVAAWDKKVIELHDRRFIKLHTRSALFMPLNMDEVMAELQRVATEADALMPPEDVMILSRDLSPWKAEQLYSVSKEVEGAENVILNGSFASMVFEGEYKNAGKWMNSLKEFVKEFDRETDEVYFFYTTCPKCAEHYGKNYVIALAKLN